MRYATLALMLLACSSSASTPEGDAWVAPTDARLPTDTEGFAACLGDMTSSCPGFTSGDAVRLTRAAVAWHCLQAYDIAPAQIESARMCMCANVGAIEPSAIDTIVQRFVRAGCCGRVPLSSAWCPDAG